MNEEKKVRIILEDVLKNKDAAIVKYTKKFDHILLKPNQFRVTKDEIKEAVERVDKEFISVLRLAIKNIYAYHEKQKIFNQNENLSKGALAVLRALPIDSVGIYVPGGRASYPS
mgnify:FL=1